MRDVHQRSGDGRRCATAGRRNRDRTRPDPHRRRARNGDGAASRRDHHGRQPPLGGRQRPAADRRASARHAHAAAHRRRGRRGPASTCSPSTRSRKRTGARSAAEVDALMDLGASFARREAAAFAREGVRVRVIGRRDRLPIALREALDDARNAHRRRRPMTLNLAVDYGARTRVVRRRCGRSPTRSPPGGSSPTRSTKRRSPARLWTAGMPDPDLLIRTGGDLRLSNFLLYQCAYTELWSTAGPLAAIRRARLRRRPGGVRATAAPLRQVAVRPPGASRKMLQ